MTKQLLRGAMFVAIAMAISACTPKDPKFAFTYAEKRGVLDANGLRFVIVPDKSTQLVEVDVRYEVGSREDPVGKAGIAHLVEHLMFNLKPDGEGTPPLMHFISQLATQFNAYTIWDYTHYQTLARAEQLDDLLKIEAMRLFYGCQTITEDEFLREREVVRNEIRQRGGTAEGQIPQLVLDAVYPKGHAYARMVGGDDNQLTSITLDDACKFIKDYYVPERATVVIAGGVDFEKTAASIKKWFGKLEDRKGAPRAEVDPVEAKPGRTQIDLDIERDVVAITWPLPDQSTPEGEAARYGVWNAWFRTAIAASEYEFAYGVQPEWLGGPEAPTFSIIITLKSLDRLQEALDFVWKGARAADRGFDNLTWQEFDIQRKQNKAAYLAQLEPLFGYGGRTDTIASLVQYQKEVSFDSDEEYVIHELEKFDHYDGELVKSSVHKYLDPDRATVVVFKANEQGIKGDTRSAVKFQTRGHDAIQQPEVDPKEAKHPLKVSAELTGLAAAERYELGNGMDVVLLPVESTMPLAHAMLVFDVGTVHADNPAVASWAASRLRQSMDDTALAMTGIQISGGASSDQTVFETSGVNIYLEVMIKGLERFIVAGEYNQEGIERGQKSSRENMATKEYQNDLEYRRQITGALYGADHPYAKLVMPDHMKDFGVDALNKWRRKHYSAGNATLIVAGNFDLAAAKKYIGENFGGWSRGHIDEPVGPEPRVRTGPEFIGVVEHKPGPQMTVTIGYPAPPGVDGEEGARRVMTEMLNSRMGDIRFKLGATYGTYAGRQMHPGPSAYMMGGTVDAERAGEALKAMRDGVDMMRQESDQWDIDFVRARRALIQGLLGESTVSAELAYRLYYIDEYGLDADFYNKLLKMVAAVAPAQVRAMVKRELDPSREVVVVSADKATLEKAFADAGITDFKLVEPSYTK